MGEFNSEGHNIYYSGQESLRRNGAKWLSEEALQIAEKRREATGKGERER